jgi:hypothetical protein
MKCNIFRTHSTPIGRLYEIEGDFLPSVTTVQSGFKPTENRFVNDFMGVGTLGHWEALQPYKPDMPKPEVVFNSMTDEEINTRLDAIGAMWQKCKPKHIIDVEFAAYNKDIRAAGQIDLIAKEFDGYILGDIKTGQYYKHYDLQLGAYYWMTKDVYDIKESRLYILDSNIMRNAKILPEIIIYTKGETEEFAQKFLVKAKKFNESMDEYVKKMGVY